MASRLRFPGGRRPFGPAVLSLSLLLAPLAAQAPQSEETLSPGDSRERPIQAGEAHAWRIAAPPGADLLVTVEQRGIDLVVEGRGSSGKPVAVDASNGRWGAEVLLLEDSGEARVEVRSLEPSAAPGSYVLRAEEISAGDPRRPAFALLSQAGQECHLDTAEASARALVDYREAAAAWHKQGEKAWEAEALTGLAGLEDARGDFGAAGKDFEAALALWRELGEERREAQVLNWLGGKIYLRTKPPEATREALEGALAIWQRLGGEAEKAEAAETRGNLSRLALQNGSLPEALSGYQDNLTYYHQIRDQGNEALTLNNLGGVYSAQGKPDDALAAYEKARALHHDLGHTLDEARALTNLGDLRRKLGDWQEALDLYDQALALTASRDDGGLRLSLLNNIAYIYNELGEPQQAVGIYEEVLKLRRGLGDRIGEITVLNNLGSTLRKLGETQRALDLHGQALERAGKLGNKGQQAFSHLRLAEDRLDRREADAALRELDASLSAFREAENRGGETDALQLRGRVLALAGKATAAVPVLQDALARRQDLRDRAGEAEALATLAEVERAAGQPAQALADAEAAVNRVEELRSGLDSPRLRTSFLATRHRAFSQWIDLLLEQGRGRDAFAASEQSHARSLLDALAAEGGAVPPELAARRASLRLRLSAKAEQIAKQGGERSAALSREVESLRTSLDDVEAEIRRRDPGRAAFDAPKPASPKEVSALLGPGTLLLEYSLGERRSVLFAVDGRGLRTYVLPSEREIEALVRRAYAELSTIGAGDTRQGEAAAKLGRILLSPVWKDAARLRRLVIVPDGALHLVPFAALPIPEAGGGRLLDRLEVASLPSATTLALERRRRHPEAARRAAVLADPVYAGAPRLPAGGADAAEPRLRGETFEPLPASRREAEALAGLAPRGQVRLRLGLEANREAVLSGKLRGYRVLHFATHAVADARVPELSGLVLSQVDAAGHPRNGFVSLADLYGLDLDADLVVLSGCQSALGQEVRGEGLVGLARGFQLAGVPRVVASLWRVQDRATAELMTRFYRAMWQGGLPPAAALRQAQQSLRGDLRFRAPYYWAGFVLQGDWK